MMRMASSGSAVAGRILGGRENDRLTLLLGLTTIAVLWVVPLGSSLWLDETGSYWIVSESFSQSISRALRFSGQSPLYYMLLWIARHVFGTSEVAFRLPSLMAMLIAAYLVGRLSRRLFGPQTTWLAAIAFAASSTAAFAAADARPYALGILLFAASTLCLVRLLDEGDRRFLWGYVILGAMTVYSNYVFGAALFAHGLYFVARRHDSAVDVRRLAVPSIAMGALLIPAAMDLVGLLSGSQILASVRSAPPLTELLFTIVPVIGLVGLLTGWVAGRVLGPVGLAVWPPRSALLLAGSTLVIPPVVLFVLARTASPKFFYPRYMATTSIGAALLIGCAIGRFEARTVKRAALVTLVALSLISNGRAEHQPEDWRGAARTVRSMRFESSVPVLVRTGFAGTVGTEWLSQREHREFSLAPFYVYPIPGDLIPVPFGLDIASREYLEGVIAERLSTQKMFLLLTRSPRAGVDEWVSNKAKQHGFAAKEVFVAGVRVILFQRQI